MGFIGIFLVSIGIGLAIAVVVTGGKVLFFILAFADFAILAGISVYFTHFQWGWHTVFVILGALAVCSAWFAVFKIHSSLHYILPIPILAFVGYFLVYLGYELFGNHLDLGKVGGSKPQAV